MLRARTVYIPFATRLLGTATPWPFVPRETFEMSDIVAIPLRNSREDALKNQNTMEVALSKVPAVTLGFWVIKIIATTLGEAGGNALSLTLDLGYALASVIFGVPLLVA